MMYQIKVNNVRKKIKSQCRCQTSQPQQMTIDVNRSEQDNIRQQLGLISLHYGQFRSVVPPLWSAVVISHTPKDLG